MSQKIIKEYYKTVYVYLFNNRENKNDCLGPGIVISSEAFMFVFIHANCN